MAFTQQQWLRIDELFHATLARNGRSQKTFLREAARGDDVVRAEVERLLDHYHQVGDALEPPSPQIGDECARLTDRRVGAYRLVRPVASGGMGTVWLAERADDQFRQSVAIKLVTSSILTEDLKKYFRREQQALAQLEHPFITRLIDGGTSEEGWPYLVMEYVDGKPIDIYCDENRLRISDRLELFRKVCAAVHYAHQRLVVHRDLKPNNILVGDDGRPKLLDFGISKLLDAPLDGVTHEPTRTLIRGMTPQYASPEQLRGASITTATDVYSLGVILYELLSGHRPHDRNGHSDAHWERLVCETDPIAPSVAVEQVNGIFARLRKAGTATPGLVGDLRGESTRMLRRRLRGDLDNVVMTSLQKDSRRRYTSVSELSEDVRRYLVRLPVAARKDTVTYRVTKFLKRNGKIVVVGVLGALTLLAGIAGTTVGMHRARNERDVAVKVTDFLEDVFLLATPFREGRDQGWPGFFDAAAKRIEDELDDQPAVKGRAYMAIARSYERMWQWHDVARYARKALDAYRVAYDDDHVSVAESLLLAGKGLAWVENEQAVDLLEESLAAHLALYGVEDPRTAAAMDALAMARWNATRPSEWDKAEELFRESVAVYQRCPDTNPRHLAVALGDFAVMRFHHRDFSAESESLFLEADELFQQRSEELGRTAAEYKLFYCRFLFRTGRLDERAIELDKYLEMTPHYFATYGTVLRAKWWLAEFEHARGHTEAARAHFRELLAIESGIRTWHHPENEHRLNGLRASISLSQGLDELAVLAVTLIEQLCDEEKHSGNRRLGLRLAAVGAAACREGYYEAGETLLHALAEYQETEFPDHEVGREYTRNALGACRLASGHLDEAKGLLIKSIRLLRFLGLGGLDLKRTAYSRMIELYEALGERNKAARYQDMISELYETVQ